MYENDRYWQEHPEDLLASEPVLPRCGVRWDHLGDSWLHWVASRRAGNNPRGDFIRDTRDLINENPVGFGEEIVFAQFLRCMATGCREARVEAVKLAIEYQSEVLVPILEAGWSPLPAWIEISRHPSDHHCITLQDRNFPDCCPDESRLRSWIDEEGDTIWYRGASWSLESRGGHHGVYVKDTSDAN